MPAPLATSRIVMPSSPVTSLSSMFSVILFTLALPLYYPGLFRNWRRNRLAGNLLDGTESWRADFKTSPTSNALTLVYDMNEILAAINRIHRTVSGTDQACLALVGFNIEGEQSPAYPGRTSFLINMGVIFKPKALQGSQHRVSGGLA